eukprot:4011126-Lingulodinium_polyedra.AAC.1
MGAARRCTALPGVAAGGSRSVRGFDTSGSRGAGYAQGGLSGGYCGAEGSTRPGTCCVSSRAAPPGLQGPDRRPPGPTSTSAGFAGRTLRLSSGGPRLMQAAVRPGAAVAAPSTPA